MLVAIVQVIVLGLGIAINPPAVIASILIVRDAPSGRPGVAFAGGWVTGLALLVVLSSYIAFERLRLFAPGSSRLLALIWIGLGLTLLTIGGNSLWRFGRRRGDAPPARWRELIAGKGLVHSFGIGVALAAFSLRNLALLAAAGTILTQSDLQRWQLIIAFTTFVGCSSLGPLAPLLVRAYGGERADSRLTTWSGWLARNMDAITAAFLGLVGGYVFLRGVLGLA